LYHAVAIEITSLKARRMLAVAIEQNIITKQLAGTDEDLHMCDIINEIGLKLAALMKEQEHYLANQ